MPRRRTDLPPWLRVVRERPVFSTLSDVHEWFDAPVRSPHDVIGLLEPRLCAEEQELFVAVLLNGQHRVIAFTEITRGLLNASLVHPREVFRLAIATGAAAIIVAHNHPSGDPSPSTHDREITKQLVAAGKLLDIPVHDHIILGRDQYVSFAELKLL